MHDELRGVAGSVEITGTAAHDHDHGGHGHGVGVMRTIQTRALWIALIVNAAYLVAEVVGGLVFHSLALMADAAHMSTDVLALSMAIIAQRLLLRASTVRHSFGLQRVEVLSAQANALLLVAASVWIIYEAFGRMGAPADIAGSGMLIVAGFGLGINVGSALLIARARGNSLNMAAAYTHMLVDAAGSVAAMIAGVGAIFGMFWLDPAISILIGLGAVWSGFLLLRTTTHILLEGTPAGLDPRGVEAAILADPAVAQVHHVHLWSLASDSPALSAHVRLKDDVSLHDAQVVMYRLKAMLAADFAISHATLEAECHECDDLLDGC